MAPSISKGCDKWTLVLLVRINLPHRPAKVGKAHDGIRKHLRPMGAVLTLPGISRRVGFRHAYNRVVAPDAGMTSELSDQSLSTSHT
jgi:hypothetical protein